MEAKEKAAKGLRWCDKLLPQKEREDDAPAQEFTVADIGFTVVFLALGWLFWQLQVWSGRRWLGNSGRGTALFVMVYMGSVLGYMLCSHMAPSRESWFWFGAVCVMAGAYTLPYTSVPLGVLHYCILLTTVGYWTLSATGRLLKSGKTSNWFLLDIVNSWFILPWGNFFRLPATLWAAFKRCCGLEEHTGKHKRGAQIFVWVLWGIASAAVILAGVLHPLMVADTSFSMLLSAWQNDVTTWVENWSTLVQTGMLHLCFAVPTALLMYGFVYGCIHNRRTCVYNKNEVCAIERGLRVVPRPIVFTTMFLVSFVYLLFISMQSKYLFGLAWGQQSVLFSYADYAKEGCTELIHVAAANLFILAAAKVLSHNVPAESRLQRLANVGLSVLSILLLATAACKMGLYISSYGLTIGCVLAGAVIVWLVIVYVAVILRPYYKVSVVRTALFTGVFISCVLCLLPLESGINKYNQTHDFAPQAVSQVQEEKDEQTGESLPELLEEAVGADDSSSLSVRSIPWDYE